MRKSAPLFCALLLSLSARRAWIEIAQRREHFGNSARSLSARRAWIEITQILASMLLSLVALRKESVDRNLTVLEMKMALLWSLSARRAWIEISTIPITCDENGSLSARRAWIEIAMKPLRQEVGVVALRKESVDRNKPYSHLCTAFFVVALRKESVDRNTPSPPRSPRRSSRSPQGERG